MKNVKLPVAAKKLPVRCSSLPLLFACRNAVVNPKGLTPVRVTNGFENLGTDIHAAIQHTIETGEVNFRKIERTYEEQDIDRAKALWAAGLKVVEQARTDMKNPQFEVEVSFETEKFAATGHIDLVDIQPDRAYVVDFKTGRTRDDHYHQMVGYAVGVWNKLGRPERYVVHVAYIYLESQEVTSFDLDVRDMKEWIKELDGLAEQYTVNRKCVYCPLNNTCPAFGDYMKGAFKLVLGCGETNMRGFRKLPAGSKSKLSVAMKMGDIAINRIRAQIKEDAIANGPIDLGNGNQYIVKTRERSVVIPHRAMPVLAKYMSAKDILKATRFSLSDLYAAAAGRVKGPMRKLAREELMKKLKEAGAIVTSDSAYLETIPAKETPCPKKKTKPRS